MRKMFRNCTYVLAFWCISNCLLAQKGLHIGFDVGPNLTFILNENDKDFLEYEISENQNTSIIKLPSIRFTGGLTVGYHFIDAIGVKLGFYQHFHGQYERLKIDYHVEDYDFEYLAKLRRNLAYFQIPLTIEFTSAKKGKSGFIGNFGIQLSILEKASYVIEAEAKQNIMGLVSNDKWESEIVGYGQKIAFPTIREYLMYYSKDLNESTFQNTLHKAQLDFVGQAGWRFALNDNLYIDAGLRFQVGLIDMENKKAETANGTKIFDVLYTHPDITKRGPARSLSFAPTVGFRYVLPL